MSVNINIFSIGLFLLAGLTASYSAASGAEYDEWQWYEASGGFMAKEKNTNAVGRGIIYINSNDDISFSIEIVDANCEVNSRALYPNRLLKVNGKVVKMKQECILRNQFFITSVLLPATKDGMNFVLNEFKTKEHVNMTDSYDRSIYYFSTNGFSEFYGQLKSAL